MPTQSTEIRTFQDLVDFLEDATGLDSKKNVDKRRMLQACDTAYKRIVAEREWTYYQQLGRVTCNAAESTGTIAYDHTGGTYERQVTLTGANWPRWALQGVLYYSNTPYEVADRISNSVITLSPNANPGDDITAGASFSIVRSTYPLPVNCRAIKELIDVARTSSPQYVSPSQLLEYQRMQGGPSGRPLYYTVIGSPDFMGAKTLQLAPAPTASTRFDFIYNRWPRPIRTQNYSVGTLSGSQGAFTLTGTGASWKELYEGAIIRLSDSKSIPTGMFGDNPFLMERAIMTRNSSTELEIDSALTEAVSSVGYVISDPLDIDVPVMWEALKACAEMCLPGHPERESRYYKGGLEQKYMYALTIASQADEATSHRRVAGGGPGGMMSFDVTPGATVSLP